MKLAITGTPGTGKTSLGKALAKLTKTNYVDVKALIEEKKIYWREKGESEKTVDLKALRKELLKILKKDGLVLESHLLCEFSLPVDLMVVLRCNPAALRKRLEKRGYPEKKIRDNLMVEALDYCLIKTEAGYGKLIQVDCSRRVSAEKLRQKIRKKQSDRVNWTSYLLHLKHA